MKNLPKEYLNTLKAKGDCVSVIIDCKADNEILSKLNNLGIAVFKSVSLDFLYSPVNTHPDMQIHFVDKTTAVVAPSAYYYYKTVLPGNINLIKGASDPGSTYPGDCAYNVARLGNKIIGNLSYLDTKIIEIYKEQGKAFVNAKQGYTKCNLCIVDENSVITEDEGLSLKLKSLGVEVLKISAGGVVLKNFPYGFIGGSSGLLNDKKLLFCGDLNLHPDSEDIKKFVNQRKVDIICLSSTKLSDIGSILYFDDSFK